MRWQKFPVLDDGFVCLVDIMGDDSLGSSGLAGQLWRRHPSGLRRPHADPLPDAAPAYGAVRDGPAQIPRPGPDGLLAAMDPPSHGLDQRAQHSLLVADEAMRRRPPADAWGRSRPRRIARGARGSFNEAAGAELSAGEADFHRGRCAVRAASGVRHRPGAGPKGPPAVDLYGSLLEDRFAQLAALPRTADG